MPHCYKRFSTPPPSSCTHFNTPGLLSFDCALTSWHCECCLALTGPLEVSLLTSDQKPYCPIRPVNAIKQGDPASGSNEPGQPWVIDRTWGHRSEVPGSLDGPKELTKRQGKPSFSWGNQETLVLRRYLKKLGRWLSMEEGPWHTGEDLSSDSFLASMGKARYHCTCSYNLRSTEHRDSGTFGAFWLPA